MTYQVPYGKYTNKAEPQTPDNLLFTKNKAYYPMESFWKGHGK
jgi:hypothetical protein